MTDDRYEIADYGYGKSAVKIMHVRRDGPEHSIREFEVSTNLTLDNLRDYLHGDNRDIIATDSQKNTVYLLAKKYGISSPEEFGMLLCRHFLDTYPQVVQARIKVEVYPWERIPKDKTLHNHAFIFTPTALRTAFVSQNRTSPPKVKASLSNMRILKTTQSSFVNFVRDDYRTLPDAADRIFSTIVDANWEYSTAFGINFDKAWIVVKDAILDKFAGPADKGISSPSVQNTLYLAGKMVLDKIDQISNIEITMPNKHYFNIDFGKFPNHLTKGASNEEVLQPVDKPAGLIQAQICRKNQRSKL